MRGHGSPHARIDLTDCCASGWALTEFYSVYNRSQENRGICVYRREAKNVWSSSALSALSRPPSTCGRWLRRGSASTFSTLPAAPVLGAVAPYRTRGTLASPAAPALNAHGSSLTYIT